MSFGLTVLGSVNLDLIVSECRCGGQAAGRGDRDRRGGWR